MRTLCLALLFTVTSLHAAEPLRIAFFKANATPEIGMPVAYVKMRSITNTPTRRKAA